MNTLTFRFTHFMKEETQTIANYQSTFTQKIFTHQSKTIATSTQKMNTHTDHSYLSNFQ